MHLLTNIDISVPVTAGGSKTGKLKATFNDNPIGIETKATGGYSAAVKYIVIVDEQGNNVEYDVLQANKGRVPIDENSFQAIYEAVKSTLPPDSDMHLRLVTLGYEILRFKMVEEFSDLTNTSQIDIVN